MSKLYKGQDGDIFIFSRVNPTSESEQEDGQLKAERINHIQLNVFKFIISQFSGEKDNKLVEKFDQVAEEKFGKIDAKLLAEFRKLITDEYNHMKKNASEQQIKDSIIRCNGDLQNQKHRYSDWQRDLKNHIERSYCAGVDTNNDNSFDAEEFQVFYEKYKGLNQHFSGGYRDSRDVCSEYYKLYNKLTPTVDGVSKGECSQVWCQIWFPVWCSLLIQDYSEKQSHKIYTISEESHLGKELLKKKQVKKDDDLQFMDQAPNLINSQGNLLLAYTSATEEQGPSLYFYDLESSRTCARVSKAELLIDCYPHKTDSGVTNIRYIKDHEIFERSVDFKQFKSNQKSLNHEIYDFAEDDSNLIQQKKLTRQGDSHDNWGNRYTLHGYTFEVFPFVNSYEDNENFLKSFQLLFLKREHSKHGHYNWCVCFQSYEDEGTLKFKATKNVEGAASIVTKQAKNEKDVKTFIVSQSPNERASSQKNVWLIETQLPQKNVKSKNTEHFHFEKEKSAFLLSFDEQSKIVPRLNVNDERITGLFISENNHFQNFSHNPEVKEAPELKQILQDKKLWNKLLVSYPFLFYTGLTPECREIIVVNLADTKQPQKIIQLPEGIQLQSLVRSNVDDRIYFHAFEANSGSRGDFELLLRFPFKKVEMQNEYDIVIRRMIKVRCDPFAKDQTKAILMEFIYDNQNDDSKLFWVAQQVDRIDFCSGGVSISPENKFVLEVQRSDQNNFFWLEESPTLGSTLRGAINISHRNKKPLSTLLNDFNLMDATYISIVVESKKFGAKQQEIISILDSDLNLLSFIVNEEKKSFEPLHDAKNLGHKLKLDAQWLVFHKKPQIDFEKYKHEYRLFSSETVGVTIKDFVVFYNIESETYSLVDTIHEKFPLSLGNDQNEIEVKHSQNVDGTDYRLMTCLNKKTSCNHFVLYPAPESRKLDLFGLQGRKNNVYTSLISDNLVLAQFHYRDVFQCWTEPGAFKHEEFYWSVLDQFGQVKPLPLKLSNSSSVVFSQQTESGSMVILNHKTEFQIVKFNLKGELVFQSTYDDEHILERTINMVQANSVLSLTTPEPDEKDLDFKRVTDSQKVLDEVQSSNNQFRFSKVFLGSSKGRLYRLASIVMADKSKDKDQIKSGSFTLFGAVEIPADNPSKKEIQAKLTVLIFMCRSEAQYQEFQEAVFQISQDSLCIFSRQAIKKSIRIISLERSDSVQESPNNLMMNAKNQSNIDYHNQSHPEEQSNDVTRKSSTQIIATNKEKLMREESLRVKKHIQNRKFMIDSSRDKLPIVDESQLLDKPDLDSHLEFVWIIFNKNSKERKIDIEKLINKKLPGEFSLKLDCLELTTKKLSLKCAENADQGEQSRDESYLQISLPEKVFVYDLSFQEPKENFSCFKMSYFVEPQNFVDLGLPRIQLRFSTHIKSQTEKERWRQVTTTHQRNVFLAKDTIRLDDCSKEEFVSLIKNYSFSDIQGLDWLSQRLQSNAEIYSTSFESVMVSYRGHNFFSMFRDQKSKLVEVLEFIKLQLRNRQIASEISESTNLPFIRRIYRILSMPTPEFQDPEQSTSTSQDEKDADVDVEQEMDEANKDNDDLSSNFKTALEESIKFDVHLRDLIMQLDIYSDEFQISDFAHDQTEIQLMLESYSTTLNEFLNDQLIQTPITKLITELEWPAEALKSSITFKQSSQAISQELVQRKVEEHFKKKDSYKLTRVKVKILKTNWLLQNEGTFPQFSDVLQFCSSERIYDTDFMKNLVLGYWEQNSGIIKYYCFAPWLCYLILTMILFTILLKNDKQDSFKEEYSQTTKYVLSVADLLLLMIQIYIEWLQLESFSVSGFREYIESFWNVLDVIQYGTTVWIIATNLQEGGYENKEIQSIVAAISLLVLWAKFFDWLRLFEQTAFFTRLLEKTVADIKYFMILFFVALSMFGSAMFMMQTNVSQGSVDLIEPVTKIFFVDMVLNQYLLGLGQFEQAGFSNHPQWFLCWLFFLGATFFTQITMLNMLIAIMGNTFEMVIEKKAIHAMDTKLQIMSDYINVITLFDKDSDNFLFIIKPVVDEDEMEDEDAWEGGFNFLRKNMFAKIDMLEQNQNKIKNQQMNQASKVKDQIQNTIDKAREDNKKVNNQTKEAIESRIEKMDEKMDLQKKEIVEGMDAKMKKLDEKLDEKMEQLNSKMGLILEAIKQSKSDD